MKCASGLVRPGKRALGPTTTRQRRPLTSAAAIVEELQSRQLPIVVDAMSGTPSELLEAALTDFLTPAPNTVVEKALSDLLAHDEKVKEEFSKAETAPSGIHPLDRFRTRNASWHLYPGHHLVYFPLRTRESDLLDDGTDVLHAPDRSWKYRLWMGGSMHFRSAPKVSGTPRRLALVERIGQVKVRDSKILVEIERVVVRADRTDSESEQRYRLPKRELKDVEPPEEQGPRLRDLAFPDTAAIKSISAEPDVTNEPYVREFRWLCFMKDKPDMSSQRKIPPPSVAILERHTMTPSPALLFRFSALTANAHAIHLDAEYSKKEYGLRERLVHGPLTLVLMLTIARRALKSLKADGVPRYIISSIDYKNHAPLYVNEPLTIVCSQVQQPPEAQNSDDSPASPPATMEIWIQRLHDDASGDPTVCVKATATLFRAAPVPSQKKAYTRALFQEAARTGATLSEGELKRDPDKLVRRTNGPFTWREGRVSPSDKRGLVRRVMGDKKQARGHAGKDGKRVVVDRQEAKGGVGHEVPAGPEDPMS